MTRTEKNMTKSNVESFLINVVRSIVVAVMLAVGAATLHAQNAAKKFLDGEAKVTMLNSYTGEPLAKPTETVVYDFVLPGDAIAMDNSPAARLLGHGPISQLKGDPNDSTPANVAANVQAAFSKTLVNELKKTPVPEPRVAKSGAEVPVNALMVHGDFTKVNEGDKTKRMIIGLGRGASDVKAHVVVAMMTKDGPVKVAEFDMDSKSGKKPGAAATMGVGSAAMAAASVAMNGATDGKSTAEGDASRMAKAVAKEIESVMTTQGWVAPAAPVATAGVTSGV
jgi:hypothetical protein